MTVRCVVDTNVLIEYLNSSESTMLVECVERSFAAGALVENLPLMTRNMDDFKSISGLSLRWPEAA